MISQRIRFAWNDHRGLCVAPGVLALIVAAVFVGRALAPGGSASAVTSQVEIQTATPSASNSSSSTHVIHWQDDVKYAKFLLKNVGASKVDIANASCNSQTLGQYFFKVFDEAGVAVASNVKATADAAKVSEDDVTFTCRYTAYVTVDDARRYRAERTSENFETTWQYPIVREYSLIDKSTLAGDGWVWVSKGGYKKNA